MALSRLPGSAPMGAYAPPQKKKILGEMTCLRARLDSGRHSGGAGTGGVELADEGELDGTSGDEGELDRTSGDSGDEGGLDGTSRDSGDQGGLDGTSRDEGELGTRLSSVP